MSYSEQNSYEKIMERMLSNPRFTDVDTRVGSVAYDSNAPVAMELAEAYIKLDVFSEQINLLTATGKNLDKRVFDYGIKREVATNALRIGTFKKQLEDKSLVEMEIPTDSRFTVPDNNDITYIYIGKIDGYNILKCEQTGTKGNEPKGTILPLSPINELAEAKITSTYQPGDNEESDNELRQRAMLSIHDVAFGGNISDYIQKVGAIEGVGNLKVFPAWQYNGSVLLSVVDDSYNPISTEFATLLKQKIDPDETSGQGVGIAPIGHYVTITTPVKSQIKVGVTLTLEEGSIVADVREAVSREIEKYFDSVRHDFAQDHILSIYRARIIEAVVKIPKIINVSGVLLNDVNQDIILKDEAKLNKQYLPYVKEVIIG